MGDIKEAIPCEEVAYNDGTDEGALERPEFAETIIVDDDEKTEIMNGLFNGSLTTLGDYRPTRAEEKLLMVLADPSNRLKTVNEISALAGIDRATYFRAFNKAGFQELNLRLGLELIKREAQPLMNVGLQFAKNGSYKHWEAMMKMAGLLVDRSEVKQIHSIEKELEALAD